MRRSITIGTAGHIDHGKTALVRALTGTDTDRLPQEKARGITIDLGFAHLELGDTRVGIVDVPGHERFVRNMLAGAAGISAGMLIVAADDSVMPQTREHLAILDLLGVRLGIVVITKTDLVADDWVDLVEQDVRELVGGTFLEGAPIVRTSATTGTGLAELRVELERLVSTLGEESHDEPFRLPVDRAFTIAGRGTVVTGTVWSGVVAVGDDLEWLPSGERVRVRGLQVHGESSDKLGRGQRAAINLSGVHHTQLQRGHELATPGFLRPTRRLTVDLRVLPDSPWPIRHRASVRLHLGTAEVIATVHLTGGGRLEPGDTSLVQFACAETVVATARQPVVVRSESPMVTIGGGPVLRPCASVLRRLTPDELDRVRQLGSDDPQVRALASIHFAGMQPWSMIDLCRDADLTRTEAARITRTLLDREMLIELSDRPGEPVLVERDRFDALAQRVEKWLARYHESNPLHAGAARTLVVQGFSDIKDDVMNAALSRLVAQGQLAVSGDALRLPSFGPNLSGAQQDLLDRAVQAYEQAGFSPPHAGELASQLGYDEATCRPMLELAVSSGQIVHLGGGLYMHAQAEQSMRRRVGDHLGQVGQMTMGELRDLLDTSRKYAVPLGEYLDRIGLTRRKGDVRVLARSLASPAG